MGEARDRVRLPPARPRCLHWSGVEAPKPDRTDVTSLRPAVGRARAPLERIAQFVAAAEAHRVIESRHFRGKLVFQVR